MSSRYPPQFLNNQSDRSSIVKWDSQIFFAFLPVVTTMVSQLSKCLKFETSGGMFYDKQLNGALETFCHHKFTNE